MAEEIFSSPKKKGRIAVFSPDAVPIFAPSWRPLTRVRSTPRSPSSSAMSKRRPGCCLPRAGLESLYLNPEALRQPGKYDKEAVRQVRKRDVDLVCLADNADPDSLLLPGFKNRSMNIHPALLPSFPGPPCPAKGHRLGGRYSGATVHFVAEEVDMEPIIIQAACRSSRTIRGHLAARILVEEHKIYPEAVRLYF